MSRRSRLRSHLQQSIEDFAIACHNPLILLEAFPIVTGELARSRQHFADGHISCHDRLRSVTTAPDGVRQFLDRRATVYSGDRENAHGE